MDSYNYRDRERDAPARSPRDREWARDDRKDDRGDNFYRGRSPGACFELCIVWARCFPGCSFSRDAVLPLAWRACSSRPSC